MVSNFCHGDRKLIFHVLRGRGICRLVLYGLRIFQVRIDVLGQKKLEIVPIFWLRWFDVIFIRYVRFYNRQV